MTTLRLLARLNIALGLAVMPIGVLQAAWGVVMVAVGVALWRVTR